MLLVFGAPCQRNLLAGQEHGQTIPLADISPEDQLVGSLGRGMSGARPVSKEIAKRLAKRFHVHADLFL